MKLFIKILLFVFVAFVTNVKVPSATITFSNIQETTTSFSFQNETPKTIYKVIENDLANCCQNGNDLVDYRNRGERLEANAAKGGTKLLNQFNSAESLIQGAGKLSRVKGAQQGFVKGNVDDIFKSITQGGKQISPNQVQLPNGTMITRYPSSTTGTPTIQINQSEKIYKIRIE